MTVNLGTRATYSHDPTTGTRQTGMNGCLFGRTRRSYIHGITDTRSVPRLPPRPHPSWRVSGDVEPPASTSDIEEALDLRMTVLCSR